MCLLDLTESQIKDLRFSASVILSFITKYTLATCFCCDIIKVISKHGTRDVKHNYIMSRNEM